MRRSSVTNFLNGNNNFKYFFIYIFSYFFKIITTKIYDSILNKIFDIAPLFPISLSKKKDNLCYLFGLFFVQLQISRNLINSNFIPN